MTRLISAFWIAVAVLVGGVSGSAARAQELVWLQVEAQPDLAGAQNRARAYAGQFGDVAGFRLSSGWYAIVIGPVPAIGAESRLADLRGLARVPPDSFVADGGNFRQQFWPVGATGLAAPATGPDTLTDGGAAPPDPEATTVIASLAPALEFIPDETVAEARRSEADLSRDQREALQTAMQWQGFYEGEIDGDFGPGTRTAMAAWQGFTGHAATGILTSRQRNALISDYQADLASLGLGTVRDQAAGIEMQLPTALVAFDHYDPPFVHFKEKAGSGVSVLLISQSGDENTLFGLYDIMQTLEIVPPVGERTRKETSFVLTGQSDTLHSYTYAELRGGLVKGYTLAWRPADAAKMTRVLAAMQTSFAPFGDRAMDDTVLAPTEEQRRDMLAGLEVRRPDFSRSGFFVDGSGRVLTSAAAVKQCGRITLDETTDAVVSFTDAALGIAVLTPKQQLAPAAYAEFQTASPRLRAEIAVAGYAYEDAIPAPNVTFGTLEDLRGLNGEASLRRLALATLTGDVGGPVLDTSGSVIGLLLPPPTGSDRVLPQDVQFAASATSILAALALGGVSATVSARQGGMPPEDLTTLAASMTVLVSCWN